MNINFTSAAFEHRLRQGGGRGQALAKAVGLSKGRTPDIIDATAGLGRDGFILAHLGATVTMIERAPNVADALAQALDVAKGANPLFSEPASRITLLRDDAITLLPKLDASTIYIDPMHPARQKSALVKRQMRDLRDLVGDDTDRDQLIELALNHARQRVVVKWPRTAKLSENLPKASYEIVGKTTRYCVFLC